MSSLNPPTYRSRPHGKRTHFSLKQLFLLVGVLAVVICRRRLFVTISLVTSYTFDLQPRNVLDKWRDPQNKLVSFDTLFPMPSEVLRNEEEKRLASGVGGIASEGDVHYNATLNLKTVDAFLEDWRQQRTHKEELIPPIMHNVFLTRHYVGHWNETAPTKEFVMKRSWSLAHQECQARHPGWHFMLWTDDEAEEFMALHHPSLFETWLAYGQTIQRSNILRYLILQQYGGVYTDLDLRCRVNLDPVRSLPLVTPGAPPSGVNNAFIASRSGHPFWAFLQPNIQYFNLYYPLPYVQNMATTGCLFFTTQHLMHRAPMQKAIASVLGRIFSSEALQTVGATKKEDKIFILPAGNNLSGHVYTPLFEHFGASSWHSYDAVLINKIPSILAYVSAFGGVVLVLSLCRMAFIWYQKRYSHNTKRYNYEDEESKPLMNEL